MPFNLPDIIFCETDADKITAAAIATYQGITGKTLLPGDPERLFIEGLLYIIIQQRQVIDYTGKMNLLGYAVKDFLDHLGIRTDTERLSAKAATVPVTFSLVATRQVDTPVPIGTRVTPDGKIFFSVSAAATIPAGQTAISLTLTCTTAGTSGNDFVAGQINQLVDPLEAAVTVTNTAKSAGGADTEKDDPYRERIQLSPEKFSTAGPEGAYEFWAETAHQDIIDVAAYSDADAVVNVHPLMKDGALPDQAILDAVTAILSVRTRRPLTDKVQVSAPTAAAYDITATYYVRTADEALLSTIQAAVDQAVSDYRAWQRAKLGRDINPDELTSRIKAAGAKRVAITAPVFTVLAQNQVAQEGTVTVTYGGLEDE